MIIDKPSTSGTLDDDMEITCVLDGFEPRLAPLVIDAIRSIEDEKVFTVIWDFVCDDAYQRMSLN